MSWFNATRRLLRRSAQRAARPAKPTLRVRQLERRRVLDAAVTSVVVCAVTSTETPGTVPSVAGDASGDSPAGFDWTPASDGSAEAAATSASLAQGAAANTPPLVVGALDQNTNEGSLLNLSALNGAPPLGLFIDLDLGDTHTAAVDWGDGSAVENPTIFAFMGSGALGATHTYADQGTYTVTIVVTDNNGGTDSDTFQVFVSGVAPTGTFGNSGPVTEGSSASVSFSNQFDPSSVDTAAGFRYAYDLDNDGTFDIGDGTYGGSGTNASQNVAAGLLTNGPGDYTIKGRIIDKDGQFTDYTTVIHVDNSPPTLTNIVGDTINENEVATISAKIVDPGVNDVFSVQVDWLDGTSDTISGLGAVDTSGTVGGTTYQWTAATRDLVLSHQYLDDGLTNAPQDTYNVSLIVSDGDLGSSGPYVAPVVVNNVAPFVVAQLNQTVNEGQLLDLSGLAGAPSLGLFIDPGTLDSHTATVDWGDGSPVESAAVLAGIGASTVGGSHVYADDGIYKVTLTVTDKDGASKSASFFVTVSNVAPTLIVPGPQNVVEGNPLSITNIGTITDPGFNNPLNPNSPPTGSVETFTYWINWGDGNIDTGTATIDHVGGPFDPTKASFDGTHIYADDGPYTVTIRIADDNMSANFVGGVNGTDFVEQQFSVIVSNDTPQLVNITGSTILENGIATVTATIDDDGAVDVFSVDVNWQDGTSDTIAGLGLSDAAGTVGGTSYTWTAATRQLQLQHQYLDDGVSPGNGTAQDDYSVQLVAHDDDGGTSAPQAAIVTVQNVAPQISDPADVTIQENGAAVLTTTITDPGTLDVFRVDVNWQDGTSDSITGLGLVNAAGTVGGTTYTWIAASRQLTVSHQYLDDGASPGNGTAQDNYAVALAVYDDDLGSGDVQTVIVTVQNVAPSVVLNAVPDINENGTATLTGSFTDIGRLDAHTVTINWGDPNNNAVSTFAIAAIQNAAGVPTLNVGDTFNSSIDGAVLTITAINATTGQVDFSVQHLYLDDGLAPGNNTTSDVSTIGVTVADDDGQSASQTATVTIHNVAPSVSLGAVPDINENGIATVTGSFTDIGLLDAHTLTVNWNDPNNAAASTFAIPAIQNAAGVPTLSVGNTFNSSTDGAVLTISGINAATGQVSFSVQHQYLDDGLALGNNTASDASTISVTVADDDGQSGNNNTAVTVHNVAPSVSLNTVPDINENGVATLTGSFTDIGRLDAHTVTVNWGDPNNAAASTFAIPAIQNATGVPTLNVGDMFNSSTDSAVLTITAINAATGQVSFSVQHQYLDDGLALGNNTASDVSIIGVTVADDDAQMGSNSVSVTVHNVAPTVTLGPVAAINENGIATLTGSYTDIGLLDAHTLTVDWGDPNNAAGSTFAVSAIRNAAGVATLNVGDTFNSTTDSAVLTITAINAATGEVSFSVQHQYLDDGLAPGNGTTSDTSTILVAVLDDDGQTGGAMTMVTVNNVAPGLVLNSVADINENGVATLTGSYTDIGLLDVHTLTIDWGDPNNSADSTFTINAIRNAAGVATLNVGDTFNSVTDGAVLTITSVNAITGQVGFSVQHQYLDDGLAPGNGTTSDISMIDVAVFDDDTGSVTTGTTVLVHNVAPTVALDAVAPINENGVATVTGSYTDIGLLDGHVLTVGWNDPNNTAPSTFTIPSIRNAAGAATLFVGDTINSTTDGAVLTITAINATTGQVSFSVQHQYLDDGPAPGNNTASDTSTIVVMVTDDDTQSGNANTNVQVKNVLPVLAVNGPVSRNEGQLLDLTGTGGLFVASFTDVGSLDLHKAQINWGDGHVEAGTIAEAGGNGTVAGSHTYADDGVYLVTIRLADDDMSAFSDATKFATGTAGVDYVEITFTVTVSNVAPSLTDTNPADNTVAEGTAFVLSNLGGPLQNMGVGISDPGFDNPLNSNPHVPPAIGDQFAETFTGYMIDWGDGTASTPVTIVNRVSGSPGTPTTALFQHAPHTYADDGVYTVRIRLADDNMSGNFTTGTNGVDFIDVEFQITVTNVNPTLAAPAPSAISINENGSVSFTVTFTDPGFDNPLNTNTPPNGGEVEESFTYDIDWGDGRQTLAGVAVAASNGAVGVPSAGSFGGSHVYADDGVYTVTVTVHDDDGGSSVRTFVVTVNNVIPTITQPLVGDDVNTQGITRIRLSFSDPGFDNPANQTPPPNGDQFQESFTYQVDWGDGTIDVITVSQVAPGSPLVINSQTRVLASNRISGSEGVSTTGSFEVEHRYLGPPDPLHPTADIVITVTLLDDNGGSVVDSIAIGNPGIQVINVAIDTTPDVPRLQYAPPQVVQTILDRTSSTPQSLQNPRVRLANSDMAVTSDRYLELQVISPEGEIVERYKLSDDALNDLRALIATLPDNHYKIYLVRTDNDSRRLVLDVYVRQGRVVDPSDDSEGTRDKPPTDDVQENKVVPLKDNPFIDEAPQEKPDGAMIELPAPSVPANSPAGVSRWLWALPAAGLTLIPQRGSWSEELDAAFDEADEHQWQRLRRAGRVRKRE